MTWYLQEKALFVPHSLPQICYLYLSSCTSLHSKPSIQLTRSFSVYPKPMKRSRSHQVKRKLAWMSGVTNRSGLKLTRVTSRWVLDLMRLHRLPRHSCTLHLLRERGLEEYEKPWWKRDKRRILNYKWAWKKEVWLENERWGGIRFVIQEMGADYYCACVFELW